MPNPPAKVDLAAPGQGTPRVASAEVNAQLIHELFLRSRSSALVGLVPMAVLAWSHASAVAPTRLSLWVALMVMLLSYRTALAHTFLQLNGSVGNDLSRWYLLEWLGAMAIGAGWASCMLLLGDGQTDALFYLRLLFMAGLASILLSVMGMATPIYASFLLVLMIGVGVQLLWLYPGYLQATPGIVVATAVYASMLVLRSRSENRRVRQWIEARLGQDLLLEQLQAAMAAGRRTQELLLQESSRKDELNRMLHETSIRDALTGAFNRGHMQDELRRRMSAHARHSLPLCVLMIDLDHFKQVNDQHGHAVGDLVLKRMMDTAKTTLREEDVFGRWGGEEFLVLLPHVELMQAAEAAERLRLAVAGMITHHEHGDVHVTISIGAAQMQGNESPESLVSRADHALYQAKANGRNNLVLGL